MHSWRIYKLCNSGVFRVDTIGVMKTMHFEALTCTGNSHETMRHKNEKRSYRHVFLMSHQPCGCSFRCVYLIATLVKSLSEVTVRNELFHMTEIWKHLALERKNLLRRFLGIILKCCGSFVIICSLISLVLIAFRNFSSHLQLRDVLKEKILRSLKYTTVPLLDSWETCPGMRTLKMKESNLEMPEAEPWTKSSFQEYARSRSSSFSSLKGGSLPLKIPRRAEN